MAAWSAEEKGTPSEGMNLRGQLQYLAFSVFEVCVGILWPSMMKVRAAAPRHRSFAA